MTICPCILPQSSGVWYQPITGDTLGQPPAPKYLAIGAGITASRKALLLEDDSSWGQVTKRPAMGSALPCPVLPQPLPAL